MTFDEYIQNPMGIANAVISNRNMYRELYTHKLDQILVREAGKIDFKLYTHKKKYIAFLKIPSELVDNFYYDVLIEFTPPKLGITGTTLKEYNVRFYSNDPSFVYTFAHAFIKNDLFITDLKDKMSKQAVKEKADIKNPKDQVGYVKSLYFAYLIMNKRGLFQKIRYQEVYDELAVKREIMDADRKIELRQEAQQRIAKQAKKAKAVVKRQISDYMQKDMVTVSPTGRVKITNNVGKVVTSKNKSSSKIKNVNKTINSKKF